MSDLSPQSSVFSSILIGALGGLAAVSVKYLGQDHSFVTQNLQLGQTANLWALLIGYIILTPILMFLGGLLACMSGEVNRMKLLAIGVAAPALITTWAGGATPDHPPINAGGANSAHLIDNFSLVSPAFAQENINPKNRGNLNATRAIKLFFGIGKQDQRYWTIVGSYRESELEQARESAAAINQADPSFGAFVGKNQPGNPYFPVIVGSYLPYSKANKLKERALALDVVTDAYLSAYPDRLPN